MIYVLYLTELLLYVCFSFLMGSFIIQLIPVDEKPMINLPKRGIQLSILGVVFFSLMPVVYLISMLQENMGLSLTIQNVFSSFEVGQAWILTFIVSFFLYMFVSIFPVFENKRYSLIALVFTVSLIFILSWAGHSASLDKIVGSIYHAIHFLSVSVWVGILLVVSWFSKNKENWLSFLKWFSPVAIISFLLTILTGFMMMTLVIEVKDYANSWVLNYGQSLLLKHLIIIPIFFFAFINGFWAKKQLQKDLSFQPIPWVKAESVVLLLVFTATAILGQQPPAYGIDATLKSNGVAPLFQYVYGGTLPTPVAVEFGLNAMSGLLFSLATAFLVLLLWSFIKKAPAILAFGMSLCFVISVYLALMLSIH
ncbi:copper resistance D family protein [Bacillus sp. FJAT-42315]|uniref:copper resistance D family protein n=1 Tax=Bacillus sp. FJAT-42315 TaxID=2014077 RepID=UPI000C249ECB|nr:CopD family protein [Bacillus sp. FJAT-42315]